MLLLDLKDLYISSNKHVVQQFRSGNGKSCREGYYHSDDGRRQLNIDLHRDCQQKISVKSGR